MASAIVLCAGFGTRLAPLTDELPKPLVPVGDRSILQHALDRLRRAGIGELAINVHHLPEAFADIARAQPVPLPVIVEPSIRGTAGGVAGVRARLPRAPVLVWNGDILVDPPLDQLLVGLEPPTLRLAVAPREAGEGTVGLDAQGNVVRLRGERFGNEARGGDYVGVLAMGAQVLAELPEQGCLIGDVALPRLRAGGSLSSALVTTPWTDAGDPPSLLAANREWLASRVLDWFVGQGASVAPEVELRQSIVGAGARVTGSGCIERSVVCPGATVSAPLRDVLVAPSGRVIPVHV